MILVLEQIKQLLTVQLQCNRVVFELVWCYSNCFYCIELKSLVPLFHHLENERDTTPSKFLSLVFIELFVHQNFEDSKTLPYMMNILNIIFSIWNNSDLSEVLTCSPQVAIQVHVGPLVTLTKAPYPL